MTTDSDLAARVAAWANENPEGAAVLRAEGAAAERSRMAQEHATALAAAQELGAAAERERVSLIRTTVPPGYGALADALIADGSTPEQAAFAVCAAVTKEQQAAASAAQAAPPAIEFVSATAKAEENKPDLDKVDPKVLAARILEIRASNPSLNILDAASQARNSILEA